MNFSGKITSSIISYLKKTTNADLNDIVDGTDLPIEFLRDPTCWLDAQKVEQFLAHFENYMAVVAPETHPIEALGHTARELKAWGVLDSVLCMIERPHDIFLQPQRFISYFISPAPPVANIRRGYNSIIFDLPISFEEFPKTLTYLRAAIEAVPLFTGAPMAECQWRQNTVSISWLQPQQTLDDPSMSERRIGPELMQNLIHTLEKTEQALHEKTLELEKIKIENQKASRSETVPAAQVRESILSQENKERMKQRILKLQDYFTRSQQLITILIGQERQSAQIREAMKRVSWEQVQESFPRVASEILQHMNEGTQTGLENSYEPNHQSPRARDSRQPWLPNN